MDRKLVKQLEKSFEKRGGRIGFAEDASPEDIRMLLEGLMECPDCRAAVLEACNADDRKEVDIDAVLRDVTLSRHH